jgi:ABC-2 type transport system ATP-binding protein
LITVDNLSKSYKRHTRKEGFAGLLKDFYNRQYEIVSAVKDISFHVDKGEFIGYLGPNGAGKTTTLKLLSGILKPDTGSICVMDEIPFRRRKRFLSRIGFVMGAKSQLWWDLPAMDTFRLMQSIYDIPEGKFNQRVCFLSEILSVGRLLETPVRKLSLGERMKLETICSLLHSPDIVFLDEPTIGLDLISQEAIRQFLKWYNKEYCATILLTSHYIKDIEELCERILLIQTGRIIFNGSKAELHKLYSNYILLDTEHREDILKINIAEKVFRVGNTLRHLVHRSYLEALTDRLDTLNCSSHSLKEISFEEALKIKMQDES